MSMCMHACKGMCGQVCQCERGCMRKLCASVCEGVCVCVTVCEYMCVRVCEGTCECVCKGEGMEECGGVGSGAVGWSCVLKDLAKRNRGTLSRRMTRSEFPPYPNVSANIFIQESRPVCICTKLPGGTGLET